MAGPRNVAERWFVRAFSAPGASRLAGRLADARLPGPLLRAAMRAYIRAYRVDMSEVAEPLSAHSTFNAFFTRRLRPGARPVSTEPGVAVAPCDSRVVSIGSVPEDGRIEQVKGRTYTLAALLGSEEDARAFARGVHATLYLSPSMYHRVHSPVDGLIRAWRYLPGRLFPVNTLAIRHVEGLFTLNERVSILIDAPEVGPVAVVMVGAANVGRMSLSFAPLLTNTGARAGEFRADPVIPFARGAELGAFNLGSTVVLLVADPTLEPAGVSAGQLVRMGQPLWRRPKGAS
ncbi:MAG TPA: archaetidylserine decarboxylase [Vicinamibacteria bacterium]|nr:archaetidylserine decarboxylase [Vicinamibacteria bacterium]